MKTFRFFATLLVIALCAGFTSCSDDDEEENSVEISLANLQGTWNIFTISISCEIAYFFKSSICLLVSCLSLLDETRAYITAVFILFFD